MSRKNYDNDGIFDMDSDDENPIQYEGAFLTEKRIQGQLEQRKLSKRISYGNTPSTNHFRQNTPRSLSNSNMSGTYTPTRVARRGESPMEEYSRRDLSSSTPQKTAHNRSMTLYQELNVKKEAQKAQDIIIQKNNYKLAFIAGVCFSGLFSWTLASHVSPSLINDNAFKWTGFCIASMTALSCFLLLSYVIYTKQTTKRHQKFNMAGLIVGFLGCVTLSLTLADSTIFHVIPPYVVPLCFTIATFCMAAGRKSLHDNNNNTKSITSIGTVFLSFQFIAAYALLNEGWLLQTNYLNGTINIDSQTIIADIVIGCLCLGVIGAIGLIAKDTINAAREEIISSPAYLSNT